MAPFYKEILYTDPVNFFNIFSSENDLFFLDSSQVQAKLGRYSYLGFSPLLKINSQDESIWVDGKNMEGNPFDIVQQCISSYQATAIPGLPPFQGGAVGYFGYELLHHLENIPKVNTDYLGVPDLNIAIYDTIIAIDNIEERAWIIAHGFAAAEDCNREQYAAEQIELLGNKIQEKMLGIATEFKNPLVSLDEDLKPNFDKISYCAAIQNTIDYIYAGDIFQANISQCFLGELPDDITPIDLYLRLRKINPAPFSAFLRYDDVVVASTSPERFISLNQKSVQARPIKGTRQRSHDPVLDKAFAEELLASEKDKAENIMIVDLVRNDLSRVCEPDSVEVTQLCDLESYETVHHLVSVVEGVLDESYNAIDLLKATFPCGSITGAPKIRSMEIISELEDCKRGVYCGSVGYIGFDGSMDTSIAIRTITLNGKKFMLNAGGGVVSDSAPEQEYSESLVKANALTRVFEISEKQYDLID